jgi:probable O-glycosylation ligase (exosortase A-associated)
MGQIALYFALVATAVASLARPWIGIVAAYVFVVLTPQAIWWYWFEGVRPVLWVLLPSLVGFGIAALTGKIDFGTLKSKRTLFVLVLWAAYTLSFYAGPYVDAGGPYRFTDPQWAISTVNKIMVLYFVACLCIDSVERVRALGVVLVGSVIYMIYWANSQYLFGGAIGRVSGPGALGGGGLYVDENNFAMLFVVALPFLWYAGFLIKNRIIRWGLWALIPLGWHAVFLTGSRGGLVGIGVTLMVVVWRSKRKSLALLLIPAFLGAFVWQAGDVMKGRASTISEYQEDASASGRLNAWGAAFNMMLEHPLTGVGIASFGPAYPDHSETKPREAHNTFFQISGESGVVAGLMYLFLTISNFLVIWKNGETLYRAVRAGSDPTLYYLNEAVLVGFTGLITCSLFLSLQLFEIFYLLCVMINAIVYTSIKQDKLSRNQSRMPMENGAVKQNPDIKQRFQNRNRAGRATE